MNGLFDNLDKPKAEVVFTCLDDSMTEILEFFTDDRLCQNINMSRTADGRWQVSGNCRGSNNWNCVMADSLVDGLATLYKREKMARGL